MNFGYDNKIITSMSNTKFFGITIENILSPKSHMDQLLPQLSATCCAIKFIKLLMPQDILKMVYCSYFHSIMDYSIIFLGNSSCNINIFRLQKKVRQSVTSLLLEVETLVENYLRN
jgi:hypothetical protein